MEDKIYVYHILRNNTYILFEGEYIEIDVTDFNFLKEKLPNSFYQFIGTYAKIRIPKNIHSILQELLAKYDLCDKQNHFITLGCAAQEAFILSTPRNVDSDLISDFVEFKNATEELLDLLKKHLFSHNKNRLKAIKFDSEDWIKSETSDKLVPVPSIVTISNSFLVKDIFTAICDNWDITKDNYEQRRQEILSDHNTFNFKKEGLMIKANVTNVLFEFLHLHFIKTQNQTYRFIGMFLMLSQINYRNVTDDIEVHEDENIDFNLEGIKHQFLQKLTERNSPH